MGWNTKCVTDSLTNLQMAGNAWVAFATRNIPSHCTAGWWRWAMGRWFSRWWVLWNSASQLTSPLWREPWPRKDFNTKYILSSVLRNTLSQFSNSLNSVSLRISIFTKKFADGRGKYSLLPNIKKHHLVSRTCTAKHRLSHGSDMAASTQSCCCRI